MTLHAAAPTPLIKGIHLDRLYGGQYVPSLSALILIVLYDVIPSQTPTDVLEIYKLLSVSIMLGTKHNGMRRQAAAKLPWPGSWHATRLAISPIYRSTEYVTSCDVRTYDGHDYWALLPLLLVGHHFRALRVWGFGSSPRQYHRRDPS